MNERQSALRARALSVGAGERRLVTDLDLEIAPGEFWVILGRNGCGKSLTLHTLANEVVIGLMAVTLQR